MEKFQGPTTQCVFGGGNLDVDDEGVLEEQCHGNTGFNFSYGAPYYNLQGETFTIQEEESVPVTTSLEDKMPFLEMLKSVDSSPYYYYSDPAAPPAATLNPHFRMLLTLQQQEKGQIPHFSGSSSSDQSSMDYYYCHQMEAPPKPPAVFEPESCVITAPTTTKAENQAQSSVKLEDDKEREEQEHMEQLEQDQEQDYYLSLRPESKNNENDNKDNGELGEEPPNYSSPECLNSRQTVSSPTTTCCLAETESTSPHDTPSKTKSARKQAPAARQVTSSTTPTSGGGGGGGGHEREKKKRKRTRPNKNREEVESQRMTHIAVERNRRKQMNDHLNALRSLMPSSFVQRGDQASIIGGAIDFVKELEQLLQSLEAKKRIRTCSEDEDENEKGGMRNRNCSGYSSLAPFLGFFSSPQYTSYSSSLFLKNAAEEEDEEEEVIDEDKVRIMSSNNIKSRSSNEHGYYSLLSPSSWLGVDIEVVVVQTHVNLKILGPRKPGQLVRVIAALEQDLRLSVLHLNVTSSQQSVLYSFNLKIEDDCKLGSSPDEIATAVYQIFSSTNSQLHLIS